MAEVDNLIAQWITSHLHYLVGVLLLVWVVRRRGRDLRHRLFATLYNFVSKKVDLKLKQVKEEFFLSLGSITSHDPALRKENGIRILEIGAGIGANFPYYPDGSRLTVVDPNPHFAKYYNENRKKYPNIRSQEMLITTGEEMAGLSNGSVDVVVMTIVLCSVQDTDKLLKQVLRVLVPGGKLYVMEHIKEFNPDKYWIRSRLQEFLTVTHIWPLFNDGCCLNRDPLPQIKNAGFSKVDAERFYIPLTSLLYYCVKPHLKVIAIK